jgi:hypothetical protein
VRPSRCLGGVRGFSVCVFPWDPHFCYALGMLGALYTILLYLFCTLSVHMVVCYSGPGMPAYLPTFSTTCLYSGSDGVPVSIHGQERRGEARSGISKWQKRKGKILPAAVLRAVSFSPAPGGAGGAAAFSVRCLRRRMGLEDATTGLPSPCHTAAYLPVLRYTLALPLATCLPFNCYPAEDVPGSACLSFCLHLCLLNRYVILL